MYNYENNKNVSNYCILAKHYLHEEKKTGTKKETFLFTLFTQYSQDCDQESILYFTNNSEEQK